MKIKDVNEALRTILEKEDIDIDNVLNRKMSDKHKSKTNILIQHLSILIQDLKHDAESSKREMFQVRDILESEGENTYE